MTVIEVLAAVLGALSALVVLGSLLLAVVGLYAFVGGLRVERCATCGRPFLATSGSSGHRCHAHALLASLHGPHWHPVPGHVLYEHAAGRIHGAGHRAPR